MITGIVNVSQATSIKNQTYQNAIVVELYRMNSLIVWWMNLLILLTRIGGKHGAKHAINQGTFSGPDQSEEMRMLGSAKDAKEGW